MYLLEVFLKLLSIIFREKLLPKILHKSGNFIVLDKPYDMKINSNDANQYTLQTFLKKRCRDLANEKLHHEFYFAHRLDYATSGIICVPVNKEVCRMTSKAFELRSTKKYYVALLRGIVSADFVCVDMPIDDDLTSTANRKMCIASSKSSRDAKTIILVLQKGVYDKHPATKVLIRPITGRRHQIRTHCSYLGHTIVGDYTYSNKKDNCPPRMFLHAIRLILPNEIENLDVQTKDPFTEDLVAKWTVVRSCFQDEWVAYQAIDRIVDNC